MEIQKLTCEQFNDKYEPWLEKGHYGLSFDIPSVIEYLDKRFLEEFTKIPEFRYSQIKLKFSDARFYTTGLTRDQNSEVEQEINRLVKKHGKI